MVDQDLINDMLARPEYADLPADLVHEILDAVAAALGEEQIFDRRKKAATRNRYCPGNLQICCGWGVKEDTSTSKQGRAEWVRSAGTELL